MKIIISLFLLLIATSSYALDFSQQDKQGHAMMGCSGALLVRGFVQDVGGYHDALYGVLGGIGAGLAYEAVLATPKTPHERLLDMEAVSAGSLICIGIARGVRLMVRPDGLNVDGSF